MTGARAHLHRLAVAAAVVAAGVAAQGVSAKTGPVDLFMCGAEKCRQLGPEVAAAASTLTERPASKPTPAAFYDVFFVIEDDDGQRATGTGALRYVPSSARIRSSTRDAGVWSAVDPALSQRLRAAAEGLAPRPGSQLNSAGDQAGPAAIAAQQAFQRSDDEPTGGVDASFEPYVVPLGFAGVLVAAAFVVFSRRRASH